MHRPDATSRPPLRLAVMDVDGALYRGRLGVDLVLALLEEGLCDRTASRALFEALRDHARGAIDGSTMSRRTTHAMAMALRGQPVAEVEAIAVRTWASVRKDVFAFARPLIAELREAGYEPAIVSGSPHEIVRCIGDDLGVRLVHGATFGQTVGRFDGRVLLATGTAGGKRRVVDTIALACGADLRASLALGTSMLEADLLRAAGDAIVFGREPFLTRAARYEGWRVATEADVLHVVRLALGGRASVRPARGNAYDRHVISSAFE